MNSLTSVSFIVSNFNGGKYLPRLVDSLKAQQEVDIELVIVDRQSSDDSASFYAKNPWIKVTRHPPEAGLVSGYAKGVKLATHDWLFFSNEDMWYAPDCVRLCLAVFKDNERVGAVMPTQCLYDGVTLLNCGIWYQPSLWCRAVPYPFRTPVYHRLRCPAEVSFANAGSCLIRRDVYEMAGGWDVTFFLDDEDTDLGIRLWQRDWQCFSVPDAIVGHAVGSSNAKTLPNVKSMVGRKRYVHALSNFMALGLKYFSPAYVPLVFLAWLDRSMRDLFKGRLGLFGLDLNALWLTIRRLPGFFRYRAVNKSFNARKPGEQFFKDSRFDYSSIRENKADRS